MKALRMVPPVVLLLLLILVFAPDRISAQVIETPVALDANGRVLVLTPIQAADALLSPPFWPVSGEYDGARLFQSSDGGFVLVVTRRNQTVERYPLTLSDVDAIRQRVSALPPRLSFRSDAASATSFIRHQTIMGVLVYGPSLAATLANEPAGVASIWLLTAGGTFFGASQFARSVPISSEMSSQSAHMSVRGALAGAAVTYAAGTSGDGAAAGILIGSMGGTAAGLITGRRWSGQEVVASQLGADLFTLTGLGMTHVARGESHYSATLRRGEAGLLTAAGVTGYVLGKTYGASASHSITPGDARSLWLTAALGATAGRIPFAGGGERRRTRALAITGGGLLGVAAGELLLARRFDLSNSDAALMALGTGAGALVGLGVARLFEPDGVTNSRTLTWSTGGGAAGLFVTHYLLAPPLDGGRPGSAGALPFDFNPAGLALTALGAQGKFPLLSLTF